MATEVGRIVARYVADTASFQRGNAMVRSEMKATQAQGRRSGSSMMSYNKYIALAGGAMVIGALKSFAAYQRNLQIFQANTDASKKTMADASRVAKQLGADLRFPGVTAGDAAESLVELSKAGLGPKQSIKALEPVLLLGTAGQIEYADAAGIAANAMNAFHLKAKDLPRVVDDIAGAALKSSSDVKDVAEAFRYTSSAAAGLGVPVDQVTTLVGLLSNLGLKGDMAGTSMRMFFTSIAKPRSNAAADQMRQMGLLIGGKKGTRKGQNQFFDKEGNIKDMNDIFKLYAKATKNMTRQQKVAAAHTIFGVRGMNQARVMEAGAKSWEKMYRASTKAGSANKLAAANTKGLYGAYQALVNTVQTLGLELGEVLAPAAIRVLHRLNGLAGVMQRNKTFVKALGAAIVAIIAGYVAWQAILIVWRTAQIINNAILMVGKGLMIAYRAAVLAIRAPIVLAMAAQWLFNAAVSANPLGIIILLIGAVVLILRHYGVSMKDVIRWMHRLWAVTKDVYAKIKGAVQYALEWIKQHWKLVIMGMVAAPALVVLLIIAHFHEIVKFLKTKLGPLMWRGMKAAFAWLFAQLKNILPLMYDVGKELGKQLGNGIKDAAIDAAKGIGNSILDDIKHPGRAMHHSIGAGIWDQAKHLGNKDNSGPKQTGRSAIHGGRRALGGGVWGRSSYLVGENGPEIFTPGMHGQITPNHAMGGGPSVNIEHMSVRSDEDPYIISSVLGRQLKLAQ